jgi:hypothetical protein
MDRLLLQTLPLRVLLFTETMVAMGMALPQEAVAVQGLRVQMAAQALGQAAMLFK